MSGLTEVPPETVNQWLDAGEALLVDVREAEELAEGLSGLWAKKALR